MSPGVLFTVLSNIPWGQVIDNAPKVADGATRLWNSVGALRKKGAPAAEAPVPAEEGVPQTPVEQLRARAKALEIQVQHLSEQMQASSELIKALADQNAQLVQRVELNRVRLRQVVISASAGLAALAGAVGYLLLRG